jgi:hypothetical protein
MSRGQKSLRRRRKGGNRHPKRVCSGGEEGELFKTNCFDRSFRRNESTLSLLSQLVDVLGMLSLLFLNLISIRLHTASTLSIPHPYLLPLVYHWGSWKLPKSVVYLKGPPLKFLSPPLNPSQVRVRVRVRVQVQVETPLLFQ